MELGDFNFLFYREYTMSFLNAEEPTVCDLITDFGINILWHPSLGTEIGNDVQKLLWDCISGKTPLDILVFEGSVVNAPNGTGEWNRFGRKGKTPYLWVIYRQSKSNTREKQHSQGHHHISAKLIILMQKFIILVINLGTNGTKY